MAVAQLRTGTEQFDAAVRSLSIPASAQSDAQALVLAGKREVVDLERAAAAPGAQRCRLPIGRWARDGGPQLALAIRLREVLTR